MNFILDNGLSICDTGIVCVIIVQFIFLFIRPLTALGHNLTVMAHTPMLNGGFLYEVI
jgi:hypothetical protein